MSERNTRLILVFSLAILLLPAVATEPEKTGIAPKSISIELVEAADLCRKKQYGLAEKRYRKLLNAVQLTKGFGHREVKPLLEGLVVALAGLGKTAEAADAKALASDVAKGTVPMGSNATAFMKSDESIIIFKRIEAKDEIGGAFIRLRSGDSPYVGTISMVGGLAPGESKLLPPLSAGSDIDEATGMVSTSKDVMQVFKEFNYRYRTEHGIATARLKNDAIDQTIAYVTGLKLCLIEKAATNVDFLQAYYRDTENLTIKERVALAHFLQPGDAGVEETFAWLYVAANEQDPSEELKALKRSLPSVFDIVKNDKIGPTLPPPKII